MLRIIVQSRLSSTRLPSKALLPIAGIPSVILCLKRAGNTGLNVCLATSDTATDDLLVKLVANENFPIYRGSLSNVLSRYFDATKDLNEDDLVVRLTADNMLPDGSFIEALVKEQQKMAVPYLRSSSKLPYGLGAECFTVKVLREAHQNATSPYDLEHVTPWIINRYGESEMEVASELENLSRIRCTLDTRRDYQELLKLFEGITDSVHVSSTSLMDRLVELSSKRNRLGLGTVQLGISYGAANVTGQPKHSQAKAILRNAFEHGISIFDTARAYGEAEELIGECWGGDYPTNFQVITKLDPLEQLSNNSTETEIIAAVDSSLKKSCAALRLIKLPVLLLHRPEHRTACEGRIWNHLIELRKQGKYVEELGVSVNSPKEALEVLEDAEVKHLQLPLNLLDYRWQEAKVPEKLSKRPDVTVYARSVYLQGILIHNSSFWPKINQEKAQEWVSKLEKLTKQLGRRNRADLCVAYVAAQTWIDYFLLGSETMEQLEENLSLIKGKPLSKKECEIIKTSLYGASIELLSPSLWSQK